MSEERAELRGIAQALGAYLLQHREAGTTGFPRGPSKPAGAEATAASANECPVTVDAVDAERSHAAASNRNAAAQAPAPELEMYSVTLPPPQPRLETRQAKPATVDRSAEQAREDMPPFIPPDEPLPRHLPAGGNRAPAASAPKPPQVEQSIAIARLPLLAQEVASCTRCAFANSRSQTVFARGNPQARLVFVGEAPSAEEDAQGMPFVGASGQLLDKMIGAMGLDPARDVYVCGTLKCTTPENRRPTPEETKACSPYLAEQLAAVRPHVIVALGVAAASALLGSAGSIAKLRGQWKLYHGETLVMPTYHPAELLRASPMQAEAKKLTWQDLQAVMRELGLTNKPNF
jgi:uracil-DNA glycosylase